MDSTRCRQCGLPFNVIDRKNRQNCHTGVNRLSKAHHYTEFKTLLEVEEYIYSRTLKTPHQDLTLNIYEIE